MRERAIRYGVNGLHRMQTITAAGPWGQRLLLSCVLIEINGSGLEQTLTVSTPNGLPGIPVSSGGNYTDESGQQWICDEVDFVRGKHVQRVFPIPLDANVFNNFNVHTRIVSGRSTITFNNVPSIAGVLGTGQGGTVMMCTFTTIVGAWNGTAPCTMRENGTLGLSQCNIVFNTEYVPEATKEAFTAFFSAHPGKILIGMPEPVETDLTEAGLAQYAALRTQYPSTTVPNGNEA